MNDDLLDEALELYFQEPHSEHNQPSVADSSIEEIDGETYAVLRNVNGVLSVYRLEGGVKNGALVKEEHPPAEILQEE